MRLARRDHREAIFFLIDQAIENDRVRRVDHFPDRRVEIGRIAATDAARLTRKEDVPRVVGEFLGFKGPAFLEVMIDPDAGVYPMVGPGQGYDEMITGDFIPSRHKVDIKTPGASEMF